MSIHQQYLLLEGDSAGGVRAMDCGARRRALIRPSLVLMHFGNVLWTKMQSVDIPCYFTE